MTTFNYASRDYDTIKSDLLARAERVMPEWTERDPSDFGMLLVDLWAMMGDVQHYYIDRAASESFLASATQRESVIAIANLFDYKPVSVYAAIGTLTLANSALVDQTVPKFTQFNARANGASYTVHVVDDTVIPAEGSSPVTVREGSIVEDEVLTDAASGLPGQSYTIQKPGCAPSTLLVDVYEDGVTPVPYTYISRLAKAQSGARVFTTQTGPDNLIEVVFGSVTNGYVPPNGVTITATYANCSGEQGNLPANSVTGPAQALASGLTVSSSTTLTGGSDAETIESMKQSIPSVIAVQDRAVTRNDFVALAQTVPGVAKATMEYLPAVAGASQSVTNKSTSSGSATLTCASHGYSVGDAVRVDIADADYDGVHVLTAVTTNTFSFASDSADEGTTAASGSVFLIGNAGVKLYVQEARSDYLTTSDTSQTVSADLQADVEAVVQEKALLGTDVSTAATIAWTPLDVTAEVFVNPKAVTNTVNGAVVAALDELFSFDNVHFGQLMHLGQIHRLLLNVPGVDYVTVSKFDLSSGGPTSVQQTLQISEFSLPKKGTYSLTFTGGISVS